MIKRILKSIKWRLRFVRGDDYYLSKYLNLFEKVYIVLHYNTYRPAEKILMKMMHVGADGKGYFKIGEFAVYFDPFTTVMDKNYYMKGVLQVLHETFVSPVLFCGQVSINRGDIVLDCGENIGTTALLFAQHAGSSGHVYAIEPLTFETTTYNIASNKFNNVVVVPVGVSNEIGRTEIEVSDFLLDSSIAKRKYTDGYYRKKVTIELTTIDDLVDRLSLSKVDYIKLDIEGVEELAILGAQKVIKKYKPKWSISSYHIDFNNEPQHDKLVALLKKFGYTVKEDAKRHIFAW